MVSKADTLASMDGHTDKRLTGKLEARGIAISMDGQGNDLENIFSEGTWRSLKYEEMYTEGSRVIPKAR